MSKTKYRVGIIGCGSIGTRYVTAFQQLGARVAVVAACDIHRRESERVRRTI